LVNGYCLNGSLQIIVSYISVFSFLFLWLASIFYDVPCSDVLDVPNCRSFGADTTIKKLLLIGL
jgi:hypothetical protein